MNKDTNGLLKSVKIISEIILVLLAVGMAYATLKERVNTNRKDININSTAIKLIGKAQQSIEVNMREMSVKQDVIGDDIKEIKEEIKK